MSQSPSAKHTKRIRRFYILCLMIFVTNPACVTPIHTILHVAEVVEVCGGSRTLIKILNRLGVLCSTDTHDRFVTQVAEKQRQKTVWDDIPSNVFTIASADNFDMLQSRAC